MGIGDWGLGIWGLGVVGGGGEPKPQNTKQPTQKKQIYFFFLFFIIKIFLKIKFK